MMGLAWRSLEARIKRDPEFRQQMIEKYRQACRDNPWLGDEFDGEIKFRSEHHLCSGSKRDGCRGNDGNLQWKTGSRSICGAGTAGVCGRSRDGFAAGLLAVKALLRLTLTYDRGREMARHREPAALTGLRVYFADPHAPAARLQREHQRPVAPIPAQEH
jgi:hypothetical protein